MISETPSKLALGSDDARPSIVEMAPSNDLANAVASFSSKSILTVDESNQSVAQEFKTNESIAIQGYSIANMKQGEIVGAKKPMNSDEIAVVH